MKLPGNSAALSVVTFTVLPWTLVWAQGSLTPPGPPAPTMKTLQQIDPGTPLDPTAFGAAGVTITEPGNYYLTGNVTLVPGTTGAIRISAADVTLDLRGFSLIAAAGSGTVTNQSAIYVSTAAFRSNITVRNGTIRGAWYAGVYAGAVPNCAVENVKVSRTNTHGIFLGSNGRIERCMVEGAPGLLTGNGIFANSHSLVKDSLVVFSEGSGIRVQLNSSVLDCVSYDSNLYGIEAAEGCLIARCTTAFHNSDGISALTGSNIVDCASYDNNSDGISVGNGSAVTRCTVAANFHSGIDTGEGATVKDCTSYQNSGDGFHTGEGSNVQNCTAALNAGQGFSIFVNNGRFSDCMAFQNGGLGFIVGLNTQVTRSTALDNGAGGFFSDEASEFSNCFAGSNGSDITHDGFEIDIRSKVVQCTATSNAGVGIRGGGLNYIDGNHVRGNSAGGILVPNNNNVVIRNVLSQNSIFGISPAPAPGGDIAPIEDAYPAAGSPNPLANFSM